MAPDSPSPDPEPDAKPPAQRRLFPPHQPYPPETDPVDEASEESFPASDAPSTWSREDA